MADVTNSDEGTVGQKGELFLREIPKEDSYSLRANIGYLYTYQEDEY